MTRSSYSESDTIDAKAWLTLLFLSLIWGSSFILMKKALVAFEPLHLAAIRVLISGMTLSPILFWYAKEIKWNAIYKYLIVGLAGNGIPAVLFFIAQTEINSSLTGLLNSLTPIWTLVIGIIIFGLPLLRYQVLGVILGFIGASILVLKGAAGGGMNNITYGFLIIIATMCYGLSGNIVKKWFQETRPLLISAGSFATISIIAIIYLCLDSPKVDIYDQQTQFSFLAVLILSLVGTALATIVFYALIQRTSAVFGSTVAYVMPIVALGWGALDGEQLGWIHLLGSVLILVGVYTIRLKKKNPFK